jgi:hypothetical protein
MKDKLNTNKWYKNKYIIGATVFVMFVLLVLAAIIGYFIISDQDAGAYNARFGIPSGHQSKEGRISATASCTDSDLGSRSQLGVVTVTAGRGTETTYADYCKDSDTAVEYLCVNNTVSSQEYSCQTDVSSSYPYFVCYGGLCVTNKLTFAGVIGYYDTVGRPVFYVVTVNSGNAPSYVGQISVEADGNSPVTLTDTSSLIDIGGVLVTEIPYSYATAYSAENMEASDYVVEDFSAQINADESIVDLQSDNDVTMDHVSLIDGDSTELIQALEGYETVNDATSTHELAIGRMSGTLNPSTNVLTLRAEIINFGSAVAGAAGAISYELGAFPYALPHTGTASDGSHSLVLNQGESLVVEESFTLDPVYVSEIQAAGNVLQNVAITIDTSDIYNEIFEGNNIKSVDVVLDIE